MHVCCLDRGRMRNQPRQKEEKVSAKQQSSSAEVCVLVFICRCATVSRCMRVLFTARQRFTARYARAGSGRPRPGPALLPSHPPSHHLPLVQVCSRLIQALGGGAACAGPVLLALSGPGLAGGIRTRDDDGMHASRTCFQCMRSFVILTNHPVP